MNGVSHWSFSIAVLKWDWRSPRQVTKLSIHDVTFPRSHSLVRDRSGLHLRSTWLCTCILTYTAWAPLPLALLPLWGEGQCLAAPQQLCAFVYCLACVLSQRVCTALHQVQRAEQWARCSRALISGTLHSKNNYHRSQPSGNQAGQLILMAESHTLKPLKCHEHPVETLKSKFLKVCKRFTGL